MGLRSKHRHSLVWNMFHVSEARGSSTACPPLSPKVGDYFWWLLLIPDQFEASSAPLHSMWQDVHWAKTGKWLVSGCSQGICGAHRMDGARIMEEGSYHLKGWYCHGTNPKNKYWCHCKDHTGITHRMMIRVINLWTRILQTKRCLDTPAVGGRN